MKTPTTKYMLILLGLLIAGPAHAATIKTKAGIVYDGKISGLIVLKGRYKEEPSDKDASKTKYSARYVVINGTDITAVDESGVHQAGNRAVGIMAVSQDDAPLDDFDVLRAGLDMPEGPFAVALLPAVYFFIF